MIDNLAFTAVIEDSQVETFPLPNGAALITRKHRVYEPMMDVYRPVSYTHLTLPTIYPV